MNKSFEKLYYEPHWPSAYAGADKLFRATCKKYDRQSVIEWLESQDAYNLHKPVRHRFPRRNYNVRNFDDVWEAYLMDMRSIKSYNDGYSYVLTVIDVISKYARAEPIKDKTSRNVANVFARILLRSNGRKPICLQTDNGKEFVGDVMQKNFIETWNCIQSGTKSGYKSCDCRKTYKNYKRKNVALFYS